MDKMSDASLSEVPKDDLRPDYDNRDPLRNVRAGSPRSHSRFAVVPTLGQGNLAVDKLERRTFSEDPLSDASDDARMFFRSSMADIVGEDILKQ
jgi:hypothetical protein